MQEAAIEACRRDILFFVNTFVWQYNPLVKGVRAVGPFITWPFQERVLTGHRGILWCYENDRTAVVEKSRDMGASWLFLIFQDWLCGFHDNVQTLDISRTADAVDSATKNALFTKVRFMHEHYPDWLMGKIVDTKMTFKYSRTYSEVTGEASTGSSGSGGRASVIFVDEFSEIKEATKVRQNTASISDCRFFNATHLGVGTEFYALTRSPECVQIQMHWTRHPRKNVQMYSWDVEAGKPRYWRYDGESDAIVETPFPRVAFPADYQFDRTGNPAGGPHPGIRSVWYDKKAEEIGTSRQVAMELDINPGGSSSQFYDPLMIRSLVERSRPPSWTGNLLIDEQMALPRHLIPGEGPLSLWIEPSMTPAGDLAKVPPGQYVAGCDVGQGTGATPSCMSIFDASRGIKVASWIHRRLDPKQFAWQAVSLCRMFVDATGRPALLAWECPGPGVIFGHEVVKEIGFRNVYWRKDEYADDEKETQTPGWFASTKTKLDLHTQYASALRSGQFGNPHREALEETLSYAHANGSVEHSKGASANDEAAAGTNHGDMVVADAIAWYAARKFSKVDYDAEPVVEVHPNSILGRRNLARAQERLRPMRRWSAIA
jgi:hypothetical protein